MTIYVVDANGAILGAFAKKPVPLPSGSTAAIDDSISGAPNSGKHQKWNGSAWEDVPGRKDAEAGERVSSAFEIDKINRLIFEINFDQENRLRALEGMPIITKTQYKNALIVKYKTL